MLQSLVEQDYVAELYLLENQVLDILLVQVLPHEAVSAGELVLKPESVHYGHYAVQAGEDAAVLQPRVHPGHGADGPGYRLRLADTAGLYDYVVEAPHLYQLRNLVHQVRLEGTADAAVLQGYQAVVLSADHPAALYQVRVYVHFSDIVHDDGEPDALLIG